IVALSVCGVGAAAAALAVLARRIVVFDPNLVSRIGTLLAHQTLAGAWFALLLAAAALALGLALWPRAGRYARLAPLLVLACDLLVTWTGFNPAIPPT